MSDELLELALRCEAASRGGVDLDEAVAVAAGWRRPMLPGSCGPKYSGRARYEWHNPNGIAVGFAAPRFTTSLDSAAMLVLDGNDYSVSREGTMGVACIYRGTTAETISGEAGAATPPLALCVAALRARASHLRMEVE